MPSRSSTSTIDQAADILDQPEDIALGLADAAQIALCTPDSILLTDDGPLYRAAIARGATALLFKDEKFRRRRFLV